jgi:hypothetical protein
MLSPILVCDSGHDSIAYVDSHKGYQQDKCPLCDAIQLINRLEATIKEIQES